MSRRPIGETAMSDAERQQRHRDKLKAFRDAGDQPGDDVATVQANGIEPEAIVAPPAAKPGPADYPRMLYHPDGRTMVVDTPDHHEQLLRDGWVTAPLPVHRQRPVTHYGFLGSGSLFAHFALPMRRW